MEINHIFKEQDYFKSKNIKIVDKKTIGFDLLKE